MKRTRVVAAVMMAISAVAWTSGALEAQTPATAVDADALAGKWRGWWVGPSKTSPLEVTINRDGTYTSRIDSDSGSGTFRVVNGKIITDGHLSGPEAPVSGRMSIVTLRQKAGRPHLDGSGHTDAGPYSFELTKE